jgi:hypothetical protein
MGEGCAGRLVTGNDQTSVPPSTEMVPGASLTRSSSRLVDAVFASKDAVTDLSDPSKALTSRVRASVSGSAVDLSSRRERPLEDVDSE